MTITLAGLALLLARMVLLWYFAELAKLVHKSDMPKVYKVLFAIAAVSYGVFALASSLTGFDNPDITRLIPITAQAVMVTIAVYCFRGKL